MSGLIGSRVEGGSRGREVEYMGGWPKAMGVKNYRASCDAPHHPTRDQQERSRKQEEMIRPKACVLDNRLRPEQGVGITKQKKRLKYTTQSTCC
jgi:hypothetical protein